MKKLDELLKSDWKIEITIGMNGIYHIEGIHWQHTPTYAAGDTLQDVINEFYRAVWAKTK